MDIWNTEGAANVLLSLKYKILSLMQAETQQRCFVVKIGGGFHLAT